MKHLILVAGLVASLSLPALAQPGPGGPVQLRNPHRRGGGDEPMGGGGPMGGGFGGGFSGMMPGGTNGGLGNSIGFYPTPQPILIAPPAVAMIADGPYLFALRGDFLYQFDKKALKLLNSAQLPEPATPPVTPESDSFTHHSNGYFGGNPGFNHAPAAPVPPPSVAISADGALLFVMRGNSLFQFEKKTLNLLNSADLPAPVEAKPTDSTTTQDDVRTHKSPPLRPGANFQTGPTF